MCIEKPPCYQPDCETCPLRESCKNRTYPVPWYPPPTYTNPYWYYPPVFTSWTPSVTTTCSQQNGTTITYHIKPEDPDGTSTK